MAPNSYFTNLLSLNAGDTLDFMGGIDPEFPGIGPVKISARVDVFTGSVPAPVIIGPVQTLRIPHGQGASMFAQVDGIPLLHYQWFFNGAPLTGETNATLTFASVQPGNSGTYSIIVSNNAGSVTGVVATLEVIAPSLRIETGDPNLILTVRGPAGRLHRILRSTNLIDWSPFATNTTDQTGTIQLQIPASSPSFFKAETD